jgi:hypothetical protein
MKSIARIAHDDLMAATIEARALLVARLEKARKFRVPEA